MQKIKNETLDRIINQTSSQLDHQVQESLAGENREFFQKNICTDPNHDEMYTSYLIKADGRNKKQVKHLPLPEKMNYVYIDNF